MRGGHGVIGRQRRDGLGRTPAEATEAVERGAHEAKRRRGSRQHLGFIVVGLAADRADDGADRGQDRRALHLDAEIHGGGALGLARRFHQLAVVRVGGVHVGVTLRERGTREGRGRRSVASAGGE